MLSLTVLAVYVGAALAAEEGTSPQSRSQAVEPSGVRDERSASAGEFLREVEREVRGSSDLHLRAYGLARLAALLWRYDPEQARVMWREAFARSLEMKGAPVRLAAEDDSTAMRAGLYRRATEASAARIQALIFRDLVDRKEFVLADELLFRLPRQKGTEASPRGLTFPLVLTHEQDLASALLRIPVARWPSSPRKAHANFTWIISRFENFPYAAAVPYLKAVADEGEYRRLAVEELAIHFKSQKLERDDVGVTLAALHGFAELLPSLEPFDARRCARLLQEKLDELKREAEPWVRLAAPIEKRICAYLESLPQACERKPAGNFAEAGQSVPREARSVLEVQRIKDRIAEAWRQGDTAGAKSHIEALEDPLSRAEIWIHLAGMTEKHSSRRELFGRVVEELQKDFEAPKSHKLYVTNLAARGALQVDRVLFEKVVAIGLEAIGEEALESKDDAEQAAVLDLAVRLVALWSIVEPERALERIRALKDPSVRVRALLEIAAADEIKRAWRP
jgi:hypothetical protein